MCGNLNEAEDRKNIKISSGGKNELLAENEALPLRVRETGYIQFIDPDIIMNLAVERNLIMQMLRKPGHFIVAGETVALVWPADKIDARLEKHLRRSVQVGNQRTPTQDIEYAVNQILEIAVRAMSPAINDPFTAMTCLDYIGESLAEYVQFGESNANFYDKDGKLRLIFEPATLKELLCAAFDMLRHSSCDNASVLLHIVETIEKIGQEAKSPEACQELLRHVTLIHEESRNQRVG